MVQQLPATEEQLADLEGPSLQQLERASDTANRSVWKQLIRDMKVSRYCQKLNLCLQSMLLVLRRPPAAYLTVPCCMVYHDLVTALPTCG